MKSIGKIKPVINRLSYLLPMALVFLTSGCNSDDDVFPNQRFECVNNTCVQDNNGSYASLSECNSVCVARYNCVDGNCQVATDGSYNSLGQCENSCGTFTTTPGGGVTDVNGIQYSSIIFGNGQEWIAQNLSTINFSNGDAIALVSDNAEWAGMNEPAYSSNNSVLYNWYVVEDPRNMCPTGWHVPSREEFNDLLGYLGEYSATYMREWGTNGNNASGFSALATGRREANGTYTGLGNSAYWWTSTPAEEQFGLGNAWSFTLDNFNASVNSAPTSDKNSGFSVRCVKD